MFNLNIFIQVKTTNITYVCTSDVYSSLTAQFQNSAPVLKNRHKILIKFRKKTSWGECDFILYFIKTYILAYVA